MIIHITSIHTLSPAAADAMRRGVEVECAECGGKGWLPSSGLLGVRCDGHHPNCPRCQGRGRVRYWDVTAKDGYFGYGYGPHDGTEAECLAKYESVLRFRCENVANGVAYDDHDYWAISTVDAIRAIRPGDALVHDGTELGQRCAEVVARVAAERGAK